MHPKRLPPHQYRGRRRLPNLPGARYAAVVTAAAAGAAIVALAASTMFPDAYRSTYGPSDPRAQVLSVEDRLNALDNANRAKSRGEPAAHVNQGAPDVWLLPLRATYVITTRYEMRWGEFHVGVDLASQYGTPYYAAHAGTVTVARWYGDYGNAVIIDNGSGIETIYGHASKLLVAEGQRVQAGQLLGLVGSTGQSTGNHLHYEVRVNGQSVNPFSFMLARGVDIDRRLEAASGGIVIT